MGLSSRGFILSMAAFVVVSLAVIGYYVATSHEGDARLRQIVAPSGDPQAGREAIRGYGCATCHEIAGIRAPGGQVGPSLVGIEGRRFLAGEIPNTPDNMVRWIMGPQAIRPGSAMPNLGVTRDDAQDVMAYLYAAGDRR